MLNKNRLKLLLRTFLHFVKLIYVSDKLKVIFYTTLIAITGLSSAVNIYFFKYFIDSLGNFDKNNLSNVLALLIYAGSQTIWSYLDDFSDFLRTQIKDKVGLVIQKEYLEKLNTISYDSFENSKISDMISKIDNWIDWRPIIEFFPVLSYLLPLCVKLILSVLVILNLGFPAVIILIIFSIPQYYVMSRIGDQEYSISDTRSARSRLYYYLTRLNVDFASKLEVRLYNSFTRLWVKIENIFKSFISGNLIAARRTLMLKVSGETLQILGQLIVIYFFVIRVSDGMTLGNIIANISFITLFTNSFTSLLERISTLRTDLVYFSDYIRLLDIKDEDRGNQQNKTDFEVLEFRDISFKYEGSEKFVLENFNLTIKKGDKLAIVGLNGSGKTTFLKLLLRFYLPTYGKILMNGVDISEIDLVTYLKEFSAIFQNFSEYSFTARENIEFGNPQVIDEELYKRSKFLADADEVIASLENLDEQLLTKRFEGGVSLSGGQWQRIAFARMYYRDAEILILDEPTSAIDAIAEAKIFKRVHEVSKDKTVIIISHRFSTVREADRIIVLSEGKIIEDGNHEELISQNGLYAEMFNAQAEGYK